MSYTHNSRVRRLALAGLGLIVAASASLVAAKLRANSSADPAAVDLAARIDRGAYLVTIGGCNDCHTPWVMKEHGPGPDMTRALSGHPHDFPVDPRLATSGGGGWAVSMAATNTAFAGPWGVSFAANLTPDELTGIGTWDEETFIRTLRTGRHWGQSRPILPPMPWFNYGKMTDEDLRSVYAYLRTLPPMHNAVPLPLPPGGAVEQDDDPWAN